MSGLSLCTLRITDDIPSLSRLLLYLSHGYRFFLQKSVPVVQVSISRVKSGLLEISQNELISAGISQTSGYPGISPIFVSLWYPCVGISWDILNFFSSKKDILTFFFIFGISWDIPGYVNFWTCFWDILGYPKNNTLFQGYPFFFMGYSRRLML